MGDIINPCFFESPSNGGGEAKKRKRVTFSQESTRGCAASAKEEKTKTSDGLRDGTFWFGRYIEDVFQRKARLEAAKTVVILAKNGRVDLLKMIRSEIADLISRSRQNPPTGNATVLIKGGGDIGAIGKAHVPYLLKHVKYLDKVIKKVVQSGISPVMTNLRKQVEVPIRKEYTYHEFADKYKNNNIKTVRYLFGVAERANRRPVVASARAEDIARLDAEIAAVATEAESDDETLDALIDDAEIAAVAAEAESDETLDALIEEADSYETFVAFIEDIACWTACILESLI